MSKFTRSSGLVAAGLGWGAAFGIALGALVIAPIVTASLASSSGTATPGTEAAQDTTVDGVEAELTLAHDQVQTADALLSESAEALVDGALTGVSVIVVRTADAHDEDVAAIQRLVESAGGSNAGEVRLNEKLFDRESADELETVVTAALPRSDEAGVDPDAHGESSGARVGDAFAAILVADPATGKIPASESERSLLLNALQDAGFISVDGELRSGEAIIVVSDKSLTDAPTDARTDLFAIQVLDDMTETIAAKRPLVHATQGVLDGSLQPGRVGHVDTEAGRINAVLSAADVLEARR